MSNIIKPTQKEIFQIYLAGWGDTDTEELSDLMKEFGKVLVPDFFEKVNPKYVVIATEGWRYNGAAVIESIEGLPDADYVNKFIVRKEKRRNGLARKIISIVDILCRDYILRADPANSEGNRFYQKRNLIFIPGEEWNLYHTKGLCGSNLETAVDVALNKEVTLLPAGHYPENGGALISLSQNYARLV